MTTIIKNAAVDTYKEFGSEYATKTELAETDADVTTLEEAIAKLLNPYKAPEVTM